MGLFALALTTLTFFILTINSGWTQETYSAMDEGSDTPAQADSSAAATAKKSPPSPKSRKKASHAVAHSRESLPRNVKSPPSQASRITQLEREISDLKEKLASGGGPHTSESVPVGSIAGAKENFDSVPENQREAVAKRLRLVEKLIREHGRAYDYRLLTNKDLEAILGQVQKNVPKPAAPTSNDNQPAEESSDLNNA